MFRKAQSWLHTHDGQQELDFEDRKGKEVEETERFLSNIDNVLINGTQLLLDQQSQRLYSVCLYQKEATRFRRIRNLFLWLSGGIPRVAELA